MSKEDPEELINMGFLVVTSIFWGPFWLIGKLAMMIKHKLGIEDEVRGGGQKRQPPQKQMQQRQHRPRIVEGTQKKGGVGTEPTTPRPPPPKGQGGTYFDVSLRDMTIDGIQVIEYRWADGTVVYVDDELTDDSYDDAVEKLKAGVD